MPISAMANYRRPPRYQPVVLCALAMMAGILWDRGCDWDYRVYLVLTGLAWIGWWRMTGFRSADSDLKGSSGSVGRLSMERRRESVASVCLLCGLMTLAAFWHHGRWNWFGPNDIGRFASSASTPCCVEAVVLTEPRELAPSAATDGLDYQAGTIRTRVTLRALRIRNGSQWQSSTGKIDLVVHAPAKHLRSGDTVRVLGSLVAIGPPSNPGQFDFQEYYRATGKFATLHSYYSECVEVIESASRFNVRALSRLRRRLNELVWRYIDADEAAFASAILLGNREQMSPQRRALFFQTGTVHLLAISGLHVGILAGAFFLLFRLGWVSRRHCLYVTIAFVIFYAWLVEFRPPVSRAAILIVLFCIGRVLGERDFSFNLLAIAGLLVLLINPVDLFNLGAQLSFLAVGALNFGRDWVFWPPSSDPIDHLIATTRPFPIRMLNKWGRGLRTAVLVSGLIWMVALPLVAFRFHLVASVALVVNPFLLLPLALALYGGLGVMAFGWFLPPVASVCGRFCEWNLGLIAWMVGVAQTLPYSHGWTSGPTAVATLIFYVGLFFVAVFPPTRLRLKWVVVLAVAWACLGWIGPDRYFRFQQPHRAPPLVCTFIDVGHGTSVLLQLPNGKTMLYDAGSFGSSNYGVRNVSGVLWDYRIGHLDAVVVSHADVDHFNALPELSRRFSIGQVVVSRQMLASQSPAVKVLLDRLVEEGIPLRTVCSPVSSGGRPEGLDSLNDICDGLSILGPPIEGTGGTDNSDSIILLIEHAGQKILLPGDLEDAGMELLLSQPAIDCGLVMAPHHGSLNSDPSEFMRWATPETVVISGGNRRIKDAVVQIFQRNNGSVLRTDRQGAIKCVIGNAGLEVEVWDDGRWVGWTD